MYLFEKVLYYITISLIVKSALKFSLCNCSTLSIETYFSTPRCVLFCFLLLLLAEGQTGSAEIFATYFVVFLIFISSFLLFS